MKIPIGSIYAIIPFAPPHTSTRHGALTLIPSARAEMVWTPPSIERRNHGPCHTNRGGLASNGIKCQSGKLLFNPLETEAPK
jgi:hypothetical protein